MEKAVLDCIFHFSTVTTVVVFFKKKMLRTWFWEKIAFTSG